jgi:two-component system, chemotaxis family, protein-glutamate methylesterase/glutaminase
MAGTRRDIIVIGGSAGGIQPLKEILAALPRDLPASVFVVLHMMPHGESHLRAVLGATSMLPVRNADDGTRFEASHVYVAQPNYHLVIQDGALRMTTSPRENRSRPSINPLFRSAAQVYGPRVVGVILSGALDDGTLGLWEVKDHGGLTIVQDPTDSTFSGMPNSAIDNVPIDYTLPARQIGPRLVALVTEPVKNKKGAKHNSKGRVRRGDTVLACPDCGGPLQQFTYGKNGQRIHLRELRCRVGHSYSPESALAAYDEADERALWQAIVALEQSADLADEYAKTAKNSMAKELRKRAKVKREQARTLRRVAASLPNG